MSKLYRLVFCLLPSSTDSPIYIHHSSMSLTYVCKLPFSLISPPKEWTLSRTLKESHEKSIWGTIYKKKMNGLESFFNFKDGIKHILTNSKVAYLQNGEQIRYFKEYHCKVIQIKHILLTNFDYN